ncbi:YadA C-terminal domain-containing protein, partial [Muribacter muris]|uniref:YadA C-terminal domain-containing protein n=1 Tax=Muribacter muris TaxID=67855 RepID=UPI000AFC7D50
NVEATNVKATDVNTTNVTATNNVNAKNITAAEKVKAKDVEAANVKASESVSVNNHEYINKQGVNGNDKRITRVARGTELTDAVNVSQLRDLEKDIAQQNKRLRAGIAGATALSFLQTPTLPGKSAVSAAVGGYRGEEAIAIGYSKNSDNNKVNLKLGVSVNTRKDVNWGGSVGYQW